MARTLQEIFDSLSHDRKKFIEGRVRDIRDRIEKRFEPRPVQGDVDFDALPEKVMEQTAESRAYLGSTNHWFDLHHALHKHADTIRTVET